VAHSGCQDFQTEHPVGDHHFLKRREFFFEKKIALPLDDEKLQGTLESDPQLRNVPGLGHIFVNGSRVDRLDGDVEFGVSRGQDTNRPRM